MNLHIIGSSSAGNAYVLDGTQESLLIECGMSWNKIQQGMQYEINKCRGCLISHEHGDHAKSVRKVIERMIPVYTSAGTARALGIDGAPMVCEIEPLTMVRRGAFKFMPFPVQHDAAEPFGYVISHPECGRVLFATDTYYLQYTFPAMNHIVIECNFVQSVLDNADIPEIRRNRTMQSHMSLDTLLEFLKANDLSHVRNIVLIHLSPDNADEELMKKAVQEQTGVNVVVAKPGVNVNLNLNPF